MDDDGLAVQEELAPLRHMNLSPSGDSPEVKFLPGTNEAHLGLLADSTRAVQFDAQAGQVVTLEEYAGPRLVDARLVHLETGDELSLPGETTLPRDGMYSLVLDASGTLDPDPSSEWVTVVLRIDDGPSSES